jgi:hypothetical protein
MMKTIDWSTVACGAFGLGMLLIASPGAMIVFIILALLAWAVGRYVDRV